MPQTYHTYITLSGDHKLLHFLLDIETGGLQFQTTLGMPGGPAPLAVDPLQQFLYIGLRASHEIANFRLDRATGDLAHLATTPLDANPCYITTDRSGKFLLSTYYGDGKVVTVHPIGPDGIIGTQAIQSIPTAKHAHYIELDRTNRFAFVPHTMPPNVLFQFQFDETN